MERMRHAEGSGIIAVFLDQLLEVSGIDPSSVSPDYKLREDLGLSRTELQLVLAKSAGALGIEVPFENCQIEEATSRQIVEILQHWARSNSLAA